MIRYERRFWVLAACLAGLAGYVDAVGFIKLGGFFVSFMSGNSTRLAVGVAMNGTAAAIAGGLVTAFVSGVVAGSFVAAAARSHRKPAVLIFVSVLLGVAALASGWIGGLWPAFAMAVAMGSANAVFQRNGEVSIPVTYMTGTLVKLGQRVAASLMGGARWDWLPYLIMWLALTTGAAIGAGTYLRFGALAIWVAAAGAMLLAAYAATLGPAASHNASGR